VAARAVVEHAFAGQVDPAMQQALDDSQDALTTLVTALEAVMTMIARHRNALAAAKRPGQFPTGLVRHFFERLGIVLARALLLALDEPSVREILADPDVAPPAAGADGLLAEIGLCRERGYTTSAGETIGGALSIASRPTASPPRHPGSACASGTLRHRRCWRRWTGCGRQAGLADDRRRGLRPRWRRMMQIAR
jgi:hypothetical protein